MNQIMDSLSLEELTVLRALQANCERLNKEIAFELGISQSKLSKILQSLQMRGYIRGKVVIFDSLKLGFHALGFLQVEFESRAAMKKAEDGLMIRQEVQEMYATNKGFELFIKARARTTGELIGLKHDIGSMEGLRSIHVIPAMLTLKETTALPI